MAIKTRTATGVDLVRMTSGPLKGKYFLQVARPNQWGFSLVDHNGREDAGGFATFGSEWTISRRAWPLWAAELLQELSYR